MPKFQISFTRGTPIALALNKKNETIFKIHVREESGDEPPDIKTENPLEVIDNEDIKKLKFSLKMGKVEEKLLKKAIQMMIKKGGTLEDSLRDVETKLNMSDKIKRAIEILVDLAEEKLKTEVDFTGSDVDRLIPLIGEKEWDRSFFISGPSGSGKTHLAKEIAKFDRKKRPLVVFTHNPGDSSLSELKKMKTAMDKKEKLIEVPLITESDILQLPTMKELRDTVVLFDDLQSFDPEIQEYLLQYMNGLLESGRHENITVMSTNHGVNRYGVTRVPKTEAEYLCVFPGSNKRYCDILLRDQFGLDKVDRDAILERAMRAGRFLILKTSAPNLIMTEKQVRLI